MLNVSTRTTIKTNAVVVISQQSIRTDIRIYIIYKLNEIKLITVYIC